MKLALAFCLWKRTELEKIVIDYYKSLRKKHNFDIVIVGSEGCKSKSIANGCKYYEFPNTPVSNKHNYLIQQCKEYDGVILIGSDDLLDQRLFDHYKELLKNPIPFYYGFCDVYYWQPKTDTLAYWSAYSMGAGRLFNKAILEKADYTLWSEGLNNGLDTDCLRRMSKMKINITQRSQKDLGYMIVDVKGFGSITDNAIVHAALDAKGNQDLSMIDIFGQTIEEIKKLVNS